MRQLPSSAKTTTRIALASGSPGVDGSGVRIASVAHDEDRGRRVKFLAADPAATILFMVVVHDNSPIMHPQVVPEDRQSVSQCVPHEYLLHRFLQFTKRSRFRVTIDGFASLWCGWAALTSVAIALQLRFGRPHASVVQALA
jgi:hypothetical protein